MKKQYKSSVTKNHKITQKKFFWMVFPYKDTQPLKLFLDFAPEIKKKHSWEYPVTNDA